MLEGSPCVAMMLRNSMVSISNPKFPSIRSSTISAIFEMSIMEVRELSHSRNVRRRFLLETTVMGPWIVVKECLV